MNAPANAAALAEPTLKMIALALIVPSNTHIQQMRRERFDNKVTKELAESIKSVGILQPPVARPFKDGKYELVAGERRYLAAKIAGLKEIPLNVRQLTDEQVLEVQLIENLQREGLHELEEAEGYDELMKLKKITADQVGEMVGKSRSYVYARLKLTALCPEARKAFYAGELDASRALLIARIGHHDTQRQALNDVVKGPRHGDGPLSFREAQKHIVQTYMLMLKSAPFDIKDASLVPKAGTCEACPKRTGNQRDLFADVKNADVCTDPKCFDDKRQAHYSVARKALEAKGQTVVHGADAKKIFKDWDSNYAYSRDRLEHGQYVGLDDTTYSVSPSRKVGELLGADYKPVLIQHPGTGKIYKVATQQAVAAAAARKQKERALKKPSSSGGGSSGEARNKARELEEKIKDETKEKLFAAVHAKIDQVSKEELLQIVSYFALGQADIGLVAKLWGWKLSAGYGHSKPFMKQAAKLTPPKLLKLVFELRISEEMENNYNDDELLDQAKRLKINVATIEQQVKDALTPKPKSPVNKVNADIAKRVAKAKAKKKPAAKKAKGKKK